MKINILFLALAILGSSLVNAQVPTQSVNSKCEKKLLKKIKSNMNLVHFKDYIEVGKTSKMIVTCFVNDNNVVEISRIHGTNKALIQAIIKTMEDHKVKCESEPSGKYFAFRLTFEHRIAEF